MSDLEYALTCIVIASVTLNLIQSIWLREQRERATDNGGTP